MKSFIIPKITKSGKKLLPYQLEGGNLDAIKNYMVGRCVTAYAMPIKHTFDSAWIFQLFMDDGGAFFEFSSACTQVDGWQEVGSLNIMLVVEGGKSPVSAGVDFPKYSMHDFKVDKVEVLIYEDDDVIAECGLVLSKCDGGEVVIAAGVSPGSVSILTPFATGSFNPEFPVVMCRRRVL